MTISNQDDMIDSRDIIERIEELEAMRQSWIDERDLNGILNHDMSPETEWHNNHGEEGDELNALLELAKVGEDYLPDWAYGIGLIRDSYFNEYAMDLAEELGCLADVRHWPATCIDWDQAARDLQMDYSSVKFDGVTYWGRC